MMLAGADLPVVLVWLTSQLEKDFAGNLDL